MKMALRLLIDVNVGRIVEQWLRDNGYDTIAVRDVDSSLADSQILEHGLLDNRFVITMDKDFGELVYRSGQSHSGVLLLRLETETSQEKIKALALVLSDYAESLENNFCIYQNGQLRIRKG